MTKEKIREFKRLNKKYPLTQRELNRAVKLEAEWNAAGLPILTPAECGLDVVLPAPAISPDLLPQLADILAPPFGSITADYRKGE